MEPDFHDFEHAGWERAADHYGDAFGSLTSQTIPALLRAAAVERGTRLLDVASGPGTSPPKRPNSRRWSASTSRRKWSRRVEEEPSLTFQEGDAEVLP